MDPATGSVSAGRRSGAAKALRDLNPDLPADETSISPSTISWIRLRSIARSPWRVPPTDPSGLRAALATAGIRNVELLARMSPRVVLAQVGGSYTEEEVARASEIARLMRVPGLDRDSAAFLHDQIAGALKTPRALAAATGAAVKALVEAHVTGGFPSILLDDQAWNAWQRSAKRMTRQGQSVGLRSAPLPYACSKAATLADVWKASGQVRRGPGPNGRCRLSFEKPVRAGSLFLVLWADSGAIHRFATHGSSSLFSHSGLSSSSLA